MENQTVSEMIKDHRKHLSKGSAAENALKAKIAERYPFEKAGISASTKANLKSSYDKAILGLTSGTGLWGRKLEMIVDDSREKNILKDNPTNKKRNEKSKWKN